MKDRIDIGVTGTREGMTLPQRFAVIAWFHQFLKPLPTDKFDIHIHHGCCIGSDEEFALLGRFLNLWLIAHIPEKRDLMSDLAYEISDYVMPEAAYLERDRNIVDRSQLLVATPKSYTAPKRANGTWYTINYALNNDKKVTVIYPDGSNAVYTAPIGG